MPPSRAVEGTGKHPPPDFSLFLLFSSPLPRAFLPLPCAYNVPIPAGSTQPESITPRGTLLETRALSPAGRPSSPSSSSSQWPHTPLLIPPGGVGSTWGGGFMPPHQLQFCNRAVDSLCCCCMNRVCRVSAPAAVCGGGRGAGRVCSSGAAFLLRASVSLMAQEEKALFFFIACTGGRVGLCYAEIKSSQEYSYGIPGSAATQEWL